MPPSAFWLRLIDPYRAGDWDECIRRTRRAVDAEPFEPSPRHLLARLYTRVEHPRLALLHYEKLLPIAVGRGDLFRALAIQRRIDPLLPSGTAAAGRYAAMQRWFRMVGKSLGIPTDPAKAPGFGPATLLAMPPEAFEAMAEGMDIVELDLTPQESDVEGGSVRVLVMGRVRWSTARPERSYGEQTVADEGDFIRIDHTLPRAALRLAPQVPSECLAFDAPLMAKLAGWVPSIAPGRAGAAPAAVPQHRSSRPGEFDAPDLSKLPRPTLSIGVPNPDDPQHLATILDAMDFSTIDLNGPAPPAAEVGDARALWRERQFDPSELEPVRDREARPAGSGDEAGPPREEAPRREEASPREEAPPSDADGSAGVDDDTWREAQMPRERSHAEPEPAAPESDEPAIPEVERRRHMRVTVALGSRVALVGMRDRAVEASVIDLSASGLALSLDLDQAGGILRALDGSAIRLELRLPPGGLALDLAGRVRSVGVASDGGSARVGVEFVMLTAHDRAAIRAAVDRIAESRGPKAA